MPRACNTRGDEATTGVARLRYQVELHSQKLCNGGESNCEEGTIAIEDDDKFSVGGKEKVERTVS